ncbi:MAG: GNAT family N-acetyltransferase [Rhodobacteraceae bacterium]|nr:GNAT family N-acetyltransferase [Paracoccaceae bacterium]
MTPRLIDTPVLQTQRLTLRAPRAADWPYWSTFAQSERAQYMGGPYTSGKAWRSFGHAIGHWVMRGYGTFVFSRLGDDTPLGVAGPWNPEDWPEKEIGWAVWHREAEGKGYAFEAASAARAWAFDVLGWATAVSYIDAPNARSIALAERLGAWHDETAESLETEADAVEVLVYRHPAPETQQ